MYRKMSLLLSAVMLVSILLTACGGGQAVQIPTATPQAEAPQPTEAHGRADPGSRDDRRTPTHRGNGLRAWSPCPRS
jgi:ABC-type glycerol-3-phosphate transport system substrate-binding protein